MTSARFLANSAAPLILVNEWSTIHGRPYRFFV
jgi:hypothetical protein